MLDTCFYFEADRVECARRLAAGERAGGVERHGRDGAGSGSGSAGV